VVETAQRVLLHSSPPQISIIIACKEIDSYAKECITKCLQLDYPQFELLLLPDHPESLPEERVRVIATGPVKPSEKRNIGVNAAKGEIVAFIDGDAYPERDWLKNSLKYFEDPKVAAVGGPGLTPQSDNTMQKASGEILSSFLGAGPLSFRHSAKLSRKCDDLPTVNLIVRRSTFKEMGGFDSSYWPGEDTKFCLDLVYRHGKDALYAPDVVVYHHRRVLFRPHLKQIAGYGLHRGYFSRKFPENSRRLLYFAPSLFILSIPAILLLGYLDESVRFLSLFPLLTYFLLVGIGATIIGFRRRSPILVGPVFVGAVATHLWYGAYFLRGLLSRKIDTHSASYKSNI
jgi:cellulose synthase/poly-beta-1,6-N-acetylglucosamine synthase-like glycosyltransferase